MTVCEALANLAWAPILPISPTVGQNNSGDNSRGNNNSSGDNLLHRVKASCNWMWPAKVEEEVTGEVVKEGEQVSMNCLW